VVEGSAPSANPLIDSVTFRGHARVSPDGRWLAFVQGAPPNIHVFVQTLEGASGRWQISTAPAVRPRWVRGGRGLVVVDPELLEPAIEALASLVRDGRVKRLAIERIDGEPVAGTEAERLLVAHGFLQAPRRVVLRA